MKMFFVLAVGLATIALFAIACGGHPSLPGLPVDHRGKETQQTPTPTAVCLTNPDPATPAFLVIATPSPGDSVTSPVTVSGQIAAFEATFKITIFAADGSPIADVVGMSQEGQVLSPFSEEVEFSTAVPKPACLWVYEASARDGIPIHVGQVPILLLPP